MKVARCVSIGAQRATGGAAGATAHATGAQQGTLKALADAVLARNGSATESNSARNLGVVEPIGDVRPLWADCAAPEPLPDRAAEARRQRVLAMLAERPGIRYAVLTDTKADPDAVILTLAIRGKATCELRIPRDRYDPFLLLDLLDKHGATVH